VVRPRLAPILVVVALATVCTPDAPDRAPAPAPSAVAGTVEPSTFRTEPVHSKALVTAYRTGPDSGWLLTSDHLYRTRDGGTTWTGAAVPPLPGGVFPSGRLFVWADTAWIVTVSEGDGVAVVTRVEEREGSAQIGLPGRHPGATSAWVAFADPRHGWVAIGGPTPGSTLYATDDGGRSWRAVGATPVDGPLHPVDSMTLFALGSRLWRSDDGGVAWRGEQPPNPAASELPARYAALSLFGTRGVLQVNVPTGMMGFAVFDVSADGGRTWTSRRAPDGAAFNNTGPPLMLSATGPDNWHISQGQRLWETTDSGRSWQEIATDLPAVNVVDLSFVSIDQAWLVATQRFGDEEVRSLYATADGGRHWAEMKAPNA
jgi:photosystem II stability/assembly factor-like uncharacterized protein